MIEGTFIDGASFDVVQSDGRSGACQFETFAVALGDGTSADGPRAAASAFILRRPDARVQYGARLISIAELTEQLAGLSSRDYALKLSKCGVWGDGASFAVACHIDGLRGHVLMPCGRDKLVSRSRAGRATAARSRAPACAHTTCSCRGGVRSTTIRRRRRRATPRRGASPAASASARLGPPAPRARPRDALEQPAPRRARRPPPRTRPRRRRSRWRRPPPTRCSARATNTRPPTSRCCRRSRHRSRRVSRRRAAAGAAAAAGSVGDRAAAVGAPEWRGDAPRCGRRPPRRTTTPPGDELVQERRDAALADLPPGDVPLRQAIAASVAAFVSGDERGRLRGARVDVAASAAAPLAARPPPTTARRGRRSASRPAKATNTRRRRAAAAGDRSRRSRSHLATSCGLFAARASTLPSARPRLSRARRRRRRRAAAVARRVALRRRNTRLAARSSRTALVASAAPASDDELSFEAPAASPGDVGEAAVETRGDASFAPTDDGDESAAEDEPLRGASLAHDDGMLRPRAPQARCHGTSDRRGGIDARATTRARRGARSSAKRRTRGARRGGGASAWARHLGVLLLLLTCPLAGVPRPSSSTSLVGAGDRGRAPGAARQCARAGRALPFNGSSAGFNSRRLWRSRTDATTCRPTRRASSSTGRPECTRGQRLQREKATAAGSLDATTTKSGAAAAAARRLARRAVRRQSEEWFELVLMSVALFGSYLLCRVARRRLANRVAPSATTGAARKRAWRRHANATPRPTSRVIRTVAAREAKARRRREGKVQPRPRAAVRGAGCGSSST